MNNDLIRVDGKFYEKCQVVMLPTDSFKKGVIRLMSDGRMGIEGIHELKDFIYPKSFNHLYILSNEDIKEGDWVMYFTSPMFCFKVNEESIWLRKKDGNSKLVGKEECSRIIATTDESLKIKVNDYSIGTIHYAGYEGVMARPSNEFLKKFCEVGGIDKVLVEYTSDSKYIKVEQGEYPIGIHRDLLKVSPDNTITIKPIKDSWSREEVIEILRRSHEDYHEHPNDLENWIKEN